MGQNHNFSVPTMYQQAIKLKPDLEIIKYNILKPGLPDLESYADHSKIERGKPKEISILTLPD